MRFLYNIVDYERGSNGISIMLRVEPFYTFHVTRETGPDGFILCVITEREKLNLVV